MGSRLPLHGVNYLTGNIDCMRRVSQSVLKTAGRHGSAKRPTRQRFLRCSNSKDTASFWLNADPRA
jgi:hypothetical protein